MNIGVTGPKGRLGSELVLRWKCSPIEKRLLELRPEDVQTFDAIINCAAYTHVDMCETEEGLQTATKTNLWGIEHLRTVFSGYLIHISTDYVFDCRQGPYTEKFSKFSPVNAYGWTKYVGEVVLLNPSPENEAKQTTIVRTTGLYGGISQNPDFASMVLLGLRENQPLAISKELHGNQTYIPHLAEALIKLARTANPPPIVHIASLEVVSRYEFAVRLANAFGLDNNLLVPCLNRDVPGWTAVRPIKGGLKVNLAKKFRLPIYTIQDGIKAYREDTRSLV